MSQKTDYLEAQILNHIFRTGTFAKPSAIYVGLFTAAPSDAGGGTEVTGGSYARVAITQADAQWSAPGTPGQIANANAVTFAAPTADWGTVTHFGIFDASSAGNLLYHGALGASRTISNGNNAPSFAAGALTVTEA